MKSFPDLEMNIPSTVGQIGPGYASKTVGEIQTEKEGL